MQLTDTHCHLDMDQFDEDRDEVIHNALNGGITKILIPGLDVATSKAAIKLAEKHPQIYAAVGVHPNSGDTWDEGTLTELEELAQHPKVAAIGEIGLDFYWDKTPRYKQEPIFQYQLELAAKLDLPVVIHNREATADVLRMITSWVAKMKSQKLALADRPGVLHSYSGNIDQAYEALEANFFLGITGPVTFKKADGLRNIVSQVSLASLLIETDAPYLTPSPFRGKRNQPYYVKYVAEKIAEIKNIPVEKVAAATTGNAKNLFNW